MTIYHIGAPLGYSVTLVNCVLSAGQVVTVDAAPLRGNAAVSNDHDVDGATAGVTLATDTIYGLLLLAIVNFTLELVVKPSGRGSVVVIVNAHVSGPLVVLFTTTVVGVMSFAALLRDILSQNTIIRVRMRTTTIPIISFPVPVAANAFAPSNAPIFILD